MPPELKRANPDYSGGLVVERRAEHSEVPLTWDDKGIYF